MKANSGGGGSTVINGLNHLLEIAHCGYHWAMESPTAYIRSFGQGDQAISFLAVGGVKAFEDISNQLFNQDKNIKKYYSYFTFCNELGLHLKKLKFEGRTANPENWDEFITLLKNRPNISIVVFAPIFGIAMDQETLELGEFTIYRPGAAKELLKDTLFDSSGISLESELNEDTTYRISIKFDAKDRIKCFEMANKAFYEFQGLANYITNGFHNVHDIRIIDHYETRDSKILVFDGQNTDLRVFHSRKFPPAFIDDPRNQDEYNGSKHLWHWITSPDTDLKRTVLDAIIWCGKATQEPDNAKAFLLYVLAIECILQFDEGKFVNPSIVSKISDMAAFMIGTSSKSRKEYAKMVVDTYSKRSAITHGGTTEVSNTDMHIVLVICHDIIRTIVTKDPYRKFQSKSQMCKYLVDLKYGIDETIEELKTSN